MVLQYLSYIFRGIAEVSGYTNLGWLPRTQVQQFPHIASDLRGLILFLLMIVCLVDLHHSQQFFSHVRMIFLSSWVEAVLIKQRIKCLAQGHCDSTRGESRTSNPSIPSLMLYQLTPGQPLWIRRGCLRLDTFPRPILEPKQYIFSVHQFTHN